MEMFIINSEEQWFSLPKEKEAKFRKMIGDRKKGRICNTGFFINDNDEVRLKGKFIKQDVKAFYHADYNSGSHWKEQGSIENLIWTLKNDVDPFPNRIQNVKTQLSKILHQDLPQILQKSDRKSLTVCVVPRSKKEDYYREDQLYFREVVSSVVNRLSNFENGTKYIVRYKNTKTTHLHKNGEGGEGDLPYPGITKDTCEISDKIKNKDILLIDDLYTKTINIDEDAIQALLDLGAKSVIFYSIGKTLSRS